MKESDRFIIGRRICSIRRFFVRLSGIAGSVCSNHRINGFKARATCTDERTESLVRGERHHRLSIVLLFVHISRTFTATAPWERKSSGEPRAGRIMCQSWKYNQPATGHGELIGLRGWCLRVRSYFVSESQDDGNFGIGLWSRYPLSHERVFHLNAPILPSIEADIELPSSTIHFITTHPLPPIGTRNFGHRNQHLALLAQRVRKQQQVTPSCSQILLGDLNLTPWSPLFEDFLASTGLQNAAAGRGLQPTWYRWPAFPFGLILDHGLHSRNMRCDQRIILSTNGSDHRALVFDFSVDDSR